MGVLLGIAMGILLGVSDFMQTVVAHDQLCIGQPHESRRPGLIAPLLLFVKPVEWRLNDIVIATLSGITLAGGLMMLYRGLTVARMGIVARRRRCCWPPYR